MTPPDRLIQQTTVRGHIDLCTERGHDWDDWYALQFVARTRDAFAQVSGPVIPVDRGLLTGRRIVRIPPLAT